MSIQKTCLLSLEGLLLALFLCSAVPAQDIAASSVSSPLEAEVTEEDDLHKSMMQYYAILLKRHKDSATLLDANAKLKALLGIIQDSTKLKLDIADAAKRQAGLIVRIKKSSGLQDGGDVLLQEAQQCQQWLQTLNTIGQAQRKMVLVLDKKMPLLKAEIGNLPLPPSFTTKTGIIMKLVLPADKTGAPFYVSKFPVSRKTFGLVMVQDDSAEAVPQTQVTLPQVLQFCKKLSLLEGGKFIFKLPTSQQTQVLTSQSLAPSLAVWIDGEWGNKKSEEYEMQKRFGAAVGTIWDPAKRLTVDSKADALYRELPQCSYSSLGFLITVEAAAGHAYRLSQVLSEMDETPAL